MSKSRLIDLTGLRFDRWLVLELGPKSSKWRWYYWKCLCDCGTIRLVSSQALRQGRSRSCGCILRDFNINCPPRLLHGESHKRSSEYGVWCRMRHRCNDPKEKRYPDYGGRGIKVCAGWGDYRNFIADMGRRPNDEMEIERIDNNGNYSCGQCAQCVENGWTANCKWATIIEQARNKRSNRHITYNGKTLLMVEWAERTGIPIKILWDRIINRRWPIERAFTEPLKKISLANRNSKIVFNGQSLTLLEWAKTTGIGLNTIWARLNTSHWPVERALTTPVINSK
jgi:hypothetical protein